MRFALRGMRRQMWVHTAPAPNAHAAGGSISNDLRNDESTDPYVYQVVSATVLNRYNIYTKGWEFVKSPALAGTFGAGATSVFAPSMALIGTIGAGCTSTSITTTTPITAISEDRLANHGDGMYGYRIRIITNSAGSAGKIEERWIVGNTSGSTPTLTLDTPLTAIPVAGDKYEILSGRLFMLSAGTLASGVWKSYEVATGLITTLGYTNLPASIGTDSTAIAMDEQYVPYDRKPGEGLIGGSGTYDSKDCLVATATDVSSITGQSSDGDAVVNADEYTRFQIRIVEDTANPTAVGQRRIIQTHTAGPSAVYTLSAAWAVQPSSNAKFVIEAPNIIVLFNGATYTYVYNYTNATISDGTHTIAADTWSIDYLPVIAAGSYAGAFAFSGLFHEPRGTDRQLRHSRMWMTRGGGASNMSWLDLASLATNTNLYFESFVGIDTGSCGCNAPATEEGMYAYFNEYNSSSGKLNQFFRTETVGWRSFAPLTPPIWPQGSTARTGKRMACYVTIDESGEKISTLMLMPMTSTVVLEMIIRGD